MDNVRFAELGGRQRPVAFNFNVAAALEDKAQPQTEVEEEVRRRVENGEDLDRGDVEEIARQHGGQQSAQNMRTMVYEMLREGHRIAGMDFETDNVRLTPGEGGVPQQEVVGQRPVTEEDVGEWLDNASEQAQDRIAEVVENYQASAQQKEQLEKHEARGEDPKK